MQELDLQPIPYCLYLISSTMVYTPENDVKSGINTESLRVENL